MRDTFTTRQKAAGKTPNAIRWATQTGTIQSVARAAFVDGPGDPSELERAVAIASAADGVNSGKVAAELLGFDSIAADGADFTVRPTASGRRAGTRRRVLAPERITVVHGIRVTSALQTLLDLAALVDADVWEQALESALRMQLTTIEAIETELPGLSRSRTPGVRTIRKVLARRPVGAPPTESLLETLMIQVIRDAGLPDPTRQVRVWSESGRIVARVDLAYPELGVFLELDGQYHLGQPVHDANRQTAVTAATGWLCGRFTWKEVTGQPKYTARRVAALLEQARRRPLVTQL